MHRLQRYHLNGLKALEAVGRLGSLQRAAEELGVSPGAISQHVIRAEQQFGRPVFSRTPRGLVPTPLGERLLARLSAGFRSLDEALAMADEAQERALTVSVAPVLAQKWLVPRLSRFRQAHPEIRIRIEAAIELVDLDASDVDLALRIGKGGWPRTRTRKLLSHRVFPICAPALAERLNSAQDLRHVPVVIDANAPGFWDPWLKPHGMTEADLGPADTFTDAGLCLDAAIAGQGVMMGWQTVAVDAMQRGLICAPFPDKWDTGGSYYAVSSAARPLGRREQIFLDWVAAEMDATAVAFQSEKS